MYSSADPDETIAEKVSAFDFGHVVYFYICGDSIACSTTSFQLMQSINHENQFGKMTILWQSKIFIKNQDIKSTINLIIC